MLSLNPPPLPPTKLQVEFYFSDSNLPRDKFLSEKVKADPEGFVDLALLAIFSRVQQLLKTEVREASAVPAATVADVADALEGAASLALSEDRKRVKRATELKDTEEVSWLAWTDSWLAG